MYIVADWEQICENKKVVYCDYYCEVWTKKCEILSQNCLIIRIAMLTESWVTIVSIQKNKSHSNSKFREIIAKFPQNKTRIAELRWNSQFRSKNQDSEIVGFVLLKFAGVLCIYCAVKLWN